mgnify:CR=1 FL=1
MKVHGKIWSLTSDAGYVPSGGKGYVAFMRPTEAVLKALASGDEETLWGEIPNWEEPGKIQIPQEKDLEDPSPIRYREGVCTIEGAEGLLPAPEGYLAFQVESESFSTGGGYRRAHLLNPQAAPAYLRELAEKLAQKATSLEE